MSRSVLLLYSLHGMYWNTFTFSSTLRVPSVRNTYILTSALSLSGTSFLGASVWLRKAPLSFETSVFTFVYPSVRPSIRMYQSSSHWTDFREIWNWGLKKICREAPNFVKIRQKKSDTLHKDISTSWCCWQHKFVIKHFCATLDNGIYLDVTRTSTIHTAGFVTFSLQQWLRKSATMLLYSTLPICYSIGGDWFMVA